MDIVNSVNWEKLKSGSDIRGTAVEGVAGQPLELCDDTVYRIGCAYAKFLSDKLKKEPKDLLIALGNDSRISGPRMNALISSALRDMGASVINCGLSSTPSMFMATLSDTLNCDASVMLTASHHPYQKNGLKFFTKSGGVEGSDIKEILAIAKAGKFNKSVIPGSEQSTDFMEKYSQILVDKVVSATGEQKPLEGLKIIVDAGNGAGGFYAERVLKVLGADTEGSQFLEPDGMFPNHTPNPEDKAAMQSICDAVKEHNADFGIIFDTDVDRAGAVGRGGAEINRNRLIALISAILLKEHKGAYIVTDSITSDGLAEFIKSRGGVHHRFKRGYKNVINEAVRLNKEGKFCPLAIETSGHAALAENYFLDDGAYLITRLLIELALLKRQGKSLEDLISGLKSAAEEAEIRMGFKTDDFTSYGNDVLEKLRQYAIDTPGFVPADVDYEGLRVSFDKDNGDGWFLLRLSLHDPIMPLNIESNMAGGAKVIAQKLYDFIKDFPLLDASNLLNFIQS